MVFVRTDVRPLVDAILPLDGGHRIATGVDIGVRAAHKCELVEALRGIQSSS